MVWSEYGIEWTFAILQIVIVIIIICVTLSLKSNGDVFVIIEKPLYLAGDWHTVVNAPEESESRETLRPS